VQRWRAGIGAHGKERRGRRVNRPRRRGSEAGGARGRGPEPVAFALR
jgi:hypothetical protein